VFNMTGLVRDLYLRNNVCQITVSGAHEEKVFGHNGFHDVSGYADVVTAPPPGVAVVNIDYKPTIDRSVTDKSARYCEAGHDSFEEQTGATINRNPIPKPDFPFNLFSHHEPFSRAKNDYDYGVVACGIKPDMRLKQWPVDYFQRVVDEVPIDWKQVGLLHDGRFAHDQTMLFNCSCLLGKTNFKQLCAVIRHARVVVCHVSLPMLIAMSCGTPCVAIMGGREDPWLFDDVRSLKVLHTIGELDCCKSYGCRRCSPIKGHADTPFPPNWLCELPVHVGGSDVGKCMELITPETVIAAVNAQLSR